MDTIITKHNGSFNTSCKGWLMAGMAKTAWSLSIGHLAASTFEKRGLVPAEIDEANLIEVYMAVLNSCLPALMHDKRKHGV